MREYKVCAFIGRFQPMHNAHLEVLREALEIAEEVVIIIGSYRAADSQKNPFSFEERREMIQACLTPKELERVHFEPVRDSFYFEEMWVTSIVEAVHKYSHNSIAITGNYKDNSSYYLKHFTEWEFKQGHNQKPLSATDIRQKIYEGDEHWDADLPEGVAKWIDEHYISSPNCIKHEKEYELIKSYKKSWDKSPFPPVFVTTDAVVIKNGHVLMIKRKDPPGQGLFALPGGFIKVTETIEVSAIRELLEETGIPYTPDELKSFIVADRTFDYPGRGDRGRIITHGYHFNLDKPGSVELPSVAGSDDASDAVWIPITDLGLKEDKIYSDHLSIIQYFLFHPHKRD